MGLAIAAGPFFYGEAPVPFDSNGVFSLVPGYLAVSGQTILASQHNPPLEDIGSGLSQVLLRSGVAPLSGNLSAAGFKITNAANGSSPQDYVTMSQLSDVIASVAAAQVPTGAVAGFRRTTPPAGWIKESGGTIGNASSGATSRANADTEALFALMWEQFNNTILPIQNSSGVATTRGASAAADFAANKRMPIFDSRTRFHRGADDGLGYDATLTVGASQADGIKNHTHPVPANSVSLTTTRNSPSTTDNFYKGGAIDNTLQFTVPASVTSNNTGGLSLETRPRSSVLLFCIKL